VSDEDSASLDRRSFLRGGFLRQLLKPVIEHATEPLNRVEQGMQAAKERMHQERMQQEQRPQKPLPPLHRPPGAISEAEFLAGCTRCGDCHAACPYGAIRNAGPQYGPAAATPMIDAKYQPCLACADTPCITACAPRVLRREPEARFPTMGTVLVVEAACVAHEGGACTRCSAQCPIPEAITLTAGKPTITAACIGCGVCVQVCPVPAALVFTPTAH
jgi:ferredoxin